MPRSQSLADGGLEVHYPGAQIRGTSVATGADIARGRPVPYGKRRHLSSQSFVSIASCRRRSPLATRWTMAARLAEWLAAAALAHEPGTAIMIATDGETFGHHKKTRRRRTRARAIMTLAAAATTSSSPTASDYLATHPARRSFVDRSDPSCMELRAWGRAMALQLRMPPGSEHLAGMARAAFARDAFRERITPRRSTIASRRRWSTDHAARCSRDRCAC